MKKKYKCEVDCANCTNKIEDAIKKIDGVEDFKINFMTQKMTLDAEEERYDEILDKVIKTGKKIDNDFNVEKK